MATRLPSWQGLRTHPAPRCLANSPLKIGDSFSPLGLSLGPCWTLGSPHGGLVGALGLGAVVLTPLEDVAMAPVGIWDPTAQAMYSNLNMGFC